MASGRGCAFARMGVSSCDFGELARLYTGSEESQAEPNDIAIESVVCGRIVQTVRNILHT
jgi:hypothetical protein